MCLGQHSAVPNRDGGHRVQLCFPERTQESTRESSYLKAGLAWDLFKVPRSVMCMQLQIIAFPGLSVNDKKDRLLSPVHYWLRNNAHSSNSVNYFLFA